MLWKSVCIIVLVIIWNCEDFNLKIIMFFENVEKFKKNNNMLVH